MDVNFFDFDLPDANIALRPAVPRDSARLLHVQPGNHSPRALEVPVTNGAPGQNNMPILTDAHVYDLPQYLRDGDVLVMNDTKVFNAALSAVRPARAVGGGGDVTVSVNLHKCIDAHTWEAFVRPAKRLRVDDIINISATLSARVVLKHNGGGVTLAFNQTGATLMEAINAAGKIPLPPYIAKHREIDARDSEDYQTVYAQHEGSVAAPTAGLHFTDELLASLKNRGVTIETITLHVGAGTFLPVSADDTDHHVMHSETFDISPAVAQRVNRARQDGRRIIAVGTTSLRALESAVSDGTLQPGARDTSIFITPGYKFRIVDGLMTNFHLPRSTLFMLVCAFSGYDAMTSAYRHAIACGYRFYSYGDSSLLWRAR